MSVLKKHKRNVLLTANLNKMSTLRQEKIQYHIRTYFAQEVQNFMALFTLAAAGDVIGPLLARIPTVVLQQFE